MNIPKAIYNSIIVKNKVVFIVLLSCLVNYINKKVFIDYVLGSHNLVLREARTLLSFGYAGSNPAPGVNRFKKFHLFDVNMKKVILDTNFLLIPGEFKIDIFTEIRCLVDFRYKFFIIDKTIDELNKIIEDKNTKVKDREYAKIGLELIKLNKIGKIKSDKKYVDDAIVEKADKDSVVATSDKELKKRLKKRGVKIIFLKKKQVLALE